MKSFAIYIPKLPGIYKWTNKINGKVYIGKSVNLYGRIRSYPNHLNKTDKISRAFKKYGIENFLLEIIETYPNRTPFIEKYILERERFWIVFYRATDQQIGYNTVIFGTDMTGIPCSELTKARISAALTGKKRTDESRKRMSQKGKGRKLSESWKNSISKGLMGRKVSKETRLRIGQSNSKAIKQIDIETNEVVAIFPSITAARKLFGGNGGSIKKAVLGQRFKAYGFKWEFVEDCNKRPIK